MGQQRRGGQALQVAQEEQVEIEGAGCRGAAALASESALDSLQELEQALGGKVTAADRYGIEERRLGDRGDRFREVERCDDEGAERFFEPVERRLENVAGVAEVAA